MLLFKTDEGSSEIDIEFPSTVPLTTILAAQSGGQPVRKVGYFQKRGGPTNPAYKRRWLVLTEYGKCIYFAESTLSQSLGRIYFVSVGLSLCLWKTISEKKLASFRLMI